MYFSKFFKILIEEKPEILIHNDEIYFKTVAKLNSASEELKEAMRELGVELYKDVKLAMLEGDGNISIISRDKNLKLTHFQRKIKKIVTQSK